MSTLVLDAWAKDSFGGDILFSIDSETVYEDNVRVKGVIDFELDLPKKMTGRLVLEADRFEVGVNEISLDWKLDRFKIETGYDQNAMTLYEIIPAFDRLVSSRNVLDRNYAFQGYVARNMSTTLSMEVVPEDAPSYSWWLRTSLSLPHMMEPQIEAGFLYQFSGEDSYAGILGLYLPFVVHPLFFNSGYTEYEHHFALSGIFADFSGDFLYSLELSAGSNVSDPIGILPLPTTLSRSYWAGASGTAGIRYKLNEMDANSSLCYSILLPTLSSTSYLQQELLVANQVHISDEVKIFVDAGVRYTRSVDTIYGQPVLQPVWNAGLRASTTGT